MWSKLFSLNIEVFSFTRKTLLNSLCMHSNNVNVYGSSLLTFEYSKYHLRTLYYLKCRISMRCMHRRIRMKSKSSSLWVILVLLCVSWLNWKKKCAIATEAFLKKVWKFSSCFSSKKQKKARILLISTNATKYGCSIFWI